MQNNVSEQVGAGFFVRLAAYLVDLLIVGIALFTVRFPLWILKLSNGDNFIFRDLIFEYSLKDMLFYLLQVTYFILLTYFTGATLGKRLFHIQVISKENRDCTFFEIVYRETVGRFLARIILYVGYLMVIVSREKFGLHDILSDTRVVYCHVKKVRVESPVTYKNVGNMQPPYGMPQTGNIQQPYVTPQSGNMQPPNMMPQSGNMQPPYMTQQSGNAQSPNEVSQSGSGNMQPLHEMPQENINSMDDVK